MNTAHTTTMNPSPNTRRSTITSKLGPATICFALLALTACGGGGDSAPAPSLGQLQGIWEGSIKSGTSTLPASSIVLADGTVWMAISDSANSTRLVKAAMGLGVSGFTGSGKSFVVGSAGGSAVSISATATEKLSLSGALVSGSNTETFSLTYQPRYETPATLADYATTWNATVGSGAVTLTLKVNATGAITGSSTTGCAYSGQIALRSEGKAPVDASLTETCGTAVVTLAGVGVLNADKTRATLAMLTADGSAASLIGLKR